MLDLLIAQLANGIVIGSTYALLGSGLALIYGTMRVLHFSHGAFYMLGAYFTFFMVVLYGIPAIIAIPAAAIAVAAIAAIVQKLTIAPVMRQEGWAFSTIAVTLGLAIIMQNLALLLWGEQYQTVPYYVEGVVDLGFVLISWQRVLILGVSLVTIVAMTVLLKYSRFGRAVRATAQDAEAAAVVGVPAKAVHTFTFAIGCGLASIGGSLLAPIYAVNPWMGLVVILKGFVVVIIGGLGSFPGAILAGFLLGIVEAIGITFTSPEWRDVISYALVIIVVWLYPEGLFGMKERRG